MTYKTVFRSTCVIALGMALLIAAGCDSTPPGPEPIATVPASGTVTLRGKPLAGYTVYLSPGPGAARASGVTDADGKFVLGTNVEGDGAPVGKHQVWVSMPAEFEGEPGREVAVDNSAASKVPAKYQDPASSGISLEVPEGGTSTLEIKL